MDPLIVFLVIVLSVLSVLLMVVGVQVILILKKLNNTLDYVNQVTQRTDTLLQVVSQPFTGVGTTLTGLRSGLRLAETFILWLKEQPRHGQHDPRS
jgi:hypothetical protein